jgi:hypothetical protein
MDWKRLFAGVLGFIMASVGTKYFDHVWNLLLGPQIGLSEDVLFGFVSIFLLVVGAIMLADSIWPGLMKDLGLRIGLKRFDAEIVGKEPFLLGGVVGFKASFRGKLEKGLFTCKVLPPKGALLPTKEKTHEWWPCYGTFQRTGTRDVGILRGSRNHEFSWDPKIPKNYPEGEYTAFVGVYESRDSGNEPVKEKQFSFLVLNPKNVSRGSPGITFVTGGPSDTVTSD